MRAGSASTTAGRVRLRALMLAYILRKVAEIPRIAPFLNGGTRLQHQSANMTTANSSVASVMLRFELLFGRCVIGPTFRRSHNETALQQSRVRTDSSR
jgi:hypothetical protein